MRDYHIEERIEAGLVLLGSEIKSVRAGSAALKDSYAVLEGGELFLFEMHIPAYPQAARFSHEPNRPRKLLLHRDEIRRLAGKMREKGYTLVPLRLYIKSGRAKVELGLARGKKKYDRRREIAARDARRDMEREARERARGSRGGSYGCR